MQHKKAIQEEVDFTRTFRIIAQSYQEIAVMKMKKVRFSVLSTRDFLNKLSQVFFEVKQAYKKKLADVKIKKHINTNKTEKQTKTSVKKLKSVFVLLSANTKLYGSIINRIFNLFIEKTKNTDGDIIIIGRVGRDLYEEQDSKKPYFYYEIPDAQITVEQLKPIMFRLILYETVNVFFGAFENVLTQRAMIANISGDSSFDTNVDSKKVPQVYYLFEPTVEHIYHFFENLIATSLFSQTVYETELARLGSRILVMEEAQANVVGKLRKLRSSERKINRLADNKKQIERLAGMSLWMR